MLKLFFPFLFIALLTGNTYGQEQDSVLRLLNQIATFDDVDSLNNLSNVTVNKFQLDEFSVAINGVSFRDTAILNQIKKDELFKLIALQEENPAKKLDLDSAFFYYKVIDIDTLLFTHLASISRQNTTQTEPYIDTLYRHAKRWIDAGKSWYEFYNTLSECDGPAPTLGYPLCGDMGWKAANDYHNNFAKEVFRHHKGDVFLVYLEEYGMSWIIYMADHNQYQTRKKVITVYQKKTSID